MKVCEIFSSAVTVPMQWSICTNDELFPAVKQLPSDETGLSGLSEQG